jgi:type II secretory pathway component PulL
VRDDEEILYNSVVLALNVYLGAKLYQLYKMKQTADALRESAERLWEEWTERD